MAAVRGSPAEVLRRPDVAIVSARRVLPPPNLQLALKALPEFDQTVTVSRSDLPAAAAALLAPLKSLELRSALHPQVVSIAQEYCDVLGYDAADVSLDLVKGVTCPRWHADSVYVRCLCTLCGAGTLWVEGRHVDRARLRNLPPGDRAGAAAITGPPSCIRQAAEGEVLYLKGALFPGCLGAVHRSPEDVDASRPRLLLKLDPPGGPACGCGAAHVHH